MSASAGQAAAFYREVAKEMKVWAVCDSGGYPAPKGSEGLRAQPFLVLALTGKDDYYESAGLWRLHPLEISWDEFVRTWVPDLTKDGLKVGVNCSGARATGYDLSPADVQKNVEASFR